MTTRPLEGRAALITGGGSGIGLACARSLLRDGASVTLAGRSEDRLRGAAADLVADAPAGATIATAICDVTQEDHVEAAVATACRATGALDIAVASAGGGVLGTVLTMSLDMWRMTLEVNLTGAFLTFKHASQAMARGQGGAIVAISSIAGTITHRLFAPYCASKAGLEMLVRCTADELGHLGIRVNAVRPGLVPTELAAALHSDPAVVDDYLAQMPIGRLGTVEDIAAGVRYLCGPESSWVTGQCFAIDGGHSLRRGPVVDGVVERFMGPDAVPPKRPR